MKKIQLTQLTKTAAAYTAASAATIDAWLWLAEQGGIMDVPGDWYVVAPVAAWALVGTPLSFHLAERLLQTAFEKRRITAFEATPPGGQGGTYRQIPFTKNGKPGTLLAHAVQSIFTQPAMADSLPPDAPQKPLAAWRVPTGDGGTVTIGEREIERFLELAGKRTKYQFSRRYWTRRRKPPIPLVRYNALMDLLTSAGLIEARTAGASGWLVGNLKPHNAVSYLKYESQYRL